MNFIQVGFITIVLSTAIASASIAQDMDKAFAAYDAGNFVTAAREFRSLAEQGNSLAQHRLGGMYDSGQGVTQDYSEAAKWTKLAAEQGFSVAQYTLGTYYSNGQGVAQDHSEAFRLYRLASGHAIAQRNIGAAYEHGSGVLQSKVKAYMWYNLASANGDDRSTEYRNDLEAKMTYAALLKARTMTGECLSSGYTNCEW